MYVAATELCYVAGQCTLLCCWPVYIARPVTTAYATMKCNYQRHCTPSIKETVVAKREFIQLKTDQPCNVHMYIYIYIYMHIYIYIYI